MNELTETTINLPTTIEDLSKFVLVGREKLTSVKAEIRAISKLDLAKEVRDQKRDEARMLSEALLDAEVKLGDMMKAIPRKQGQRKDLELHPNGGAKLKEEVVNGLGFSKTQAERFETLADNKDLVEQVKAEAIENDDIPTRTQVLNLAQVRKRKIEEKELLEDEDYLNWRTYWKIVKVIGTLSIEPEYLDSVLRSIQREPSEDFNYELNCLVDARNKIDIIIQHFRLKGGTK